MYLHIRTLLAFLVFLLTVVIVTVTSVPVGPVNAQEGADLPPASSSSSEDEVDSSSSSSEDEVDSSSSSSEDEVDSDEESSSEGAGGSSSSEEVGGSSSSSKEAGGSSSSSKEAGGSSSSSEEVPTGVESSDAACSDGKDNDMDGYIDCEDTGCVENAMCMVAILDEIYPTCGDGSCDFSNGESCDVCAEDCGLCPPSCGDGACNGDESHAICPDDCGADPIQCGDGECNGEESCSSCSNDCGECPGPPVPARSGFCGDGSCEGDENHDNCSLDCLAPPNVCGDGACRGGEGCNSCPNDCGACNINTGNVASSVVENVLRELEAREEKREVTAEVTEKSLKVLLIISQEDDQLARIMSASERRKVERLMRAELEEGRDLTNRELGYLAVTIGRANKQAGNAFRSQIALDFLLDPRVRDLLHTLPSRNKLYAAAQNGDLEMMRALLGESERSLPEIVTELDDVKNDVQKLIVLEKGNPDEVTYMNTTAYAQSSTDEMSAKERFINSIDLLKKMRAQAQDPNAALPSLEERLEYLMNRRYAIAGIVNIEPEKLEESLNEVGDGARKPSRKGLIKFLGIMQFIRSSANFEKIENSFASAVGNLRTGFAKVRAIFARGVTFSPRAEAASILEDGGFSDLAQKLQGDDLEGQKQAISDLFSTLPLLEELDANEKQSLEARAQGIRDQVAEAETIGDVHTAVSHWYVLIQGIQETARSKKNFLTRFGYRIQDFFGSSS